MEDNLSEYKTSHLPLVTYLKMMNIPLREVLCGGRGRASFTFTSVPRKMIIDFNNRALVVEPNDFAAKLSEMTQAAKRLAQQGEI